MIVVSLQERNGPAQVAWALDQMCQCSLWSIQMTKARCDLRGCAGGRGLETEQMELQWRGEKGKGLNRIATCKKRLKASTDLSRGYDRAGWWYL